MLTIQTRFIGPTNHRGSRVSARTPHGKRIVVSWEYEFDPVENHLAAAKALAAKLNLGRDVDPNRYGETLDGKGFIFLV